MEFGDKFKTLESAFKALVPSTKLTQQFERFLIEYIETVRTINEKEFINFVLGLSPDNALYEEFVKLTTI